MLIDDNILVSMELLIPYYSIKLNQLFWDGL